jgi:myo-inositol-1(or 4)-monophosphatase
MDLQSILHAALPLVNDTASFIRGESRKLTAEDIEEKSRNSLVTYVDKGAEKMLVSGLREILPEAGFITEEGSATHDGEEMKWIVDPLDGTTNFIHGIPCYSVSLALAQGDDIVLGIVHEVNMDEAFYATKGSGAFMNGDSIQVSEQPLADALVATGFPYHDYAQIERYISVFRTFMKESRGIRRLGSAAVDLAYVANGRFDSFYEFGLNGWDVAAGALIVKEAGGKVTDFSGGNDYIFGGEILAGGKDHFADFLRVLQTNET